MSLRGLGQLLGVLLISATAQVHAEEAAALHMVAVGDVGFRRAVGKGVAAGTLDPFAQVSAVLSDADLAFANLETVLSTRAIPDAHEKRIWPIIKGPVQGADALLRAGFDVVSVANNHTMDLYAGGFTDTLKNLSRVDIAAVGGGLSEGQSLKPFLKTIRGVRVGLLAFASGTNRAPHGSAYVARRWGPAPIAAVKQLRQSADVVLVSVHWGNEGHSQPSETQQQLARALIDAGADAIIGHHPHVLQAVEVYRDRPVIYSLGNFLFGKQTKVRRQSAILHLDLARHGNPVRRVLLQPVLIDESSEMPSLAKGADAAEIRARLIKISAAFRTVFTEHEGSLQLNFPAVQRQARRAGTPALLRNESAALHGLCAKWGQR